MEIYAPSAIKIPYIFTPYGPCIIKNGLAFSYIFTGMSFRWVIGMKGNKQQVLSCNNEVVSGWNRMM